MLDALCEHLETELERQETLLALARSQYKAIVARDVEYLEAKTAAIDVLTRDAKSAEKERHGILAQIVAHYRLEPEEQSLTRLIGLAPASHKRRLRELQARLRSVMGEARRQVRENARLLVRAKQQSDLCIHFLKGETAPAGAGYDAHGHHHSEAASHLGMVDRRG